MSATTDLASVSARALAERIKTKLKQSVGANSDVWAALDELVRRATVSGGAAEQEPGGGSRRDTTG